MRRHRFRSRQCAPASVSLASSVNNCAAVCAWLTAENPQPVTCRCAAVAAVKAVARKRNDGCRITEWVSASAASSWTICPRRSERTQAYRGWSWRALGSVRARDKMMRGRQLVIANCHAQRTFRHGARRQQACKRARPSWDARVSVRQIDACGPFWAAPCVARKRYL